MTKRKCPKCRKASIAQYAPFCSKRCADDDLASWITEKYRVAAEENAQASADPGADEDPDSLH